MTTLDPSLVVLADGPHRAYARRTGESRGRLVVEAFGHALLFDTASGRLVSPRGHRPPYRLAAPAERPSATSETAPAPAEDPAPEEP